MNIYLDKIKKLMEKEMVRYVIAGGMTTAVNLVSFFVLRLVTDLTRSEANVIAIMLAILFAYFANGFYVFRSEHRKRVGEIVREFVSFVGMRLFAMIVEVVGTNLLCDSFRYNEFVSKIVVQLVVLVINYIFSKCFVFKKNKRPLRDILSDNYIMVISFLVPAVFMLVLWIIAEIGPFGGHSLTMVDSLHQYLPFFSDYHDKLQNEGSLFYTWDIGMGSNLLDIIAYYMSCPLNFIIVIFDREHLYVAMCLLISIKIALSGLTMASYLGYKCKDKNNVFIIPFAIAYALSNYVIGYSWNLMWMDCILILPLVIQGFEQMMEDGSNYKLYTLSLFYGLLCNYYICFMICMFLVLQFIMTNHKNIYKAAEDTLRFAGTSVLAAAMSAFLLIPAYIGLNTTASATRHYPNWEWYGSIWDMIKQMFVSTPPIKSQGFDGGVNLYCGTFAILLIGIYIFNTKIKWYEKLKNIILLVFLMMSFNNVLLNYIWHGFHDQYGIPNRFSFLFIFVLLSMGYEAVVNIDRKQVVGVMAGIIVAFGFLVYADKNIEFDKTVIMLTWGLFVTYSIVMMLMSMLKGKGRFVMSIVMAVLCLTEVVFSAGKGYESNGTVYIPDYYGDAENLQAAIDSVKHDGSSYRSELVETNVVDESTYYNMQGVSLFGSTVSNDLVNAMHGLGFYTGANEFLFDGANPVSSAVLGIRYVFRRSDEYMSYDMNYLDTVGDVDIYQNERALKLGFMVNNNLKDWTSDAGNMFESINNFVEKSTGVAGIFSQIYPEITGSSNDITITHDNQYSEYFALSDITPGITSFSLSFDITEEQNDLYMIANCNGITKIRTYVDGQEQNYERLQYQTYHIGHMSKGAHVEIEYCFSDGVPDNTSARLTLATMNGAAFDVAYERWSKDQFKTSVFEDGYVKGQIAPEEDGLMFTSIPYDSGWTAYVDGKKTEIQTVAGAFIALDLKAGAHTIVFKYFPRGLKPGILFTLIGWLVFAFLMNAKTIKEKKKSIKAAKKETAASDAAGEADIQSEEEQNEDVVDADHWNKNPQNGGDNGESDEYIFEEDTTKLEEAMKLAEKLYKNNQKDQDVSK